MAAVVALSVAIIVGLLAARSGGGDEAALSWNALRNATYPSEFPRSKQAPLQDGVYEEEIAPGSATRLKIRIADIAGFGRIDSDSSIDVAAVLISSPGGSGTFIHLVVVLNQDDTPVPVASILLGDRVAVRSIRIQDRKIVVGMRVRGPSDPLAVLTREVTRRYSLQGDQLVLEDEQAADVPSTPPNDFAYDKQQVELEPSKPITKEGVLPAGSLVTYLVRAQAGQELRASVKSQFNNAVLSIQGINDMAQLASRSTYSTSWSGAVPSSQDYAITVVTLAGNDLKYELKLELRNAPAPAPTSTPRPAAATPTPAAGLAPTVPAPLTGRPRFNQFHLSTLSPTAAGYLDARPQSWSAAVVSPSTAALYAQNGDLELELASTVKVLIALAVLSNAERESRYVDRFELSLLWPMITISDNDSATSLWEQIGGGRGLSGYLASIGATGITPYDGPFWGTSTASATSLATVLARAVFGDLLNAPHRTLLLSLLGSVTAGQRWGVSAGAEGEAGRGDLVGLKDGWYPADAGWRVNSLGFVVSRNGKNYYTIAVLTNGQATWDLGIQTIEGVAERVRDSWVSVPH